MKRRIWLAAVAVALTAVVSIPLMAQPPQGRGAGRGAGIGAGMHQGGPGGPGGRGGLAPFLRGIELTDAQRQQIRAIHQEARTGEPDRAGMFELRKQLQLAILADPVDQQKLEQLKSAIEKAEAAALAKRVEIETRVAQVLTPEQRAKARENLASRERPAAGPGRGAGRGRR